MFVWQSGDMEATSWQVYPYMVKLIFGGAIAAIHQFKKKRPDDHAYGTFE